ncbi:hypothetical protein BO79DRAFT_265012 [Aspergillus costaricaensis CBS 115574]|uniref:Uncharacterized protein n=1 Tax=Aspergillus costaricaensis CBS 115574 TaxID=1448317 RepID=A0ACD1IDS9_9EURO|nr:hypothetical protein BO79DRAFT_265012 [Aspergillus costaricaensis CBS 115574]RAK88737.1 hypothetical protein BO79DRAFT_265012 [Aspergillus costaricaensis CBS 115574]
MGTISRTRVTTGARPTKSRALPTPVSPLTCAPPPSGLLGRLERMCLNLHRAREGGARAENNNKKKNNNVATVLRPPGLTLHIRQPGDRDLWHCIRHARSSPSD